MKDHHELKKILNDYKLISNIDYLIACGKNGFTDLRFTKLDKKLTEDSKYYLATDIDAKPFLLYHPNLLDLRKEIDEKMIKNKYFNGYDKKNNRVLLHHKYDGIFRIGNKNGTEEFLVNFDICDLSKLAKRKNYKAFIDLASNKDKHQYIQLLLCELGVSQGYNVKLARNDSKSILSSAHCSIVLNNIISVNDLDISHIKESSHIQNIDLIDVLWSDPITKQVIAAFEVERSKNYDSVFRRFSSLTYLYPYKPYLICVGDDYNGFKNSFRNDIFKTFFKSSNLNYLRLDNLYEILYLNKKYKKYIPIEILFEGNLIKMN